jgi:NAD(P)-dependent dehydrogenase (short-subunit alcohol dehydrogenase family)
MSGLDLSGKVAIVTGAGAGLGRAYALQLAKQGAAVLVNDPGKDKSSGASLAEKVVGEIKAAGGKAAANMDFVTKNMADANKIVKAAMDAFGGLHIIVNNAGILQDVGFRKQTDDQWSVIQEIHLYGQRNMCKAAWDHFNKQEYGRIINVASINGVLGAHGQTNYSAAKSGIIGFSFALAKEGMKKNIKVNALVPGAGTAMTATVMPKDIVDASKPEYVAPLVGFLSSDAEEVPTGKVLESGCGFFAELQWKRSPGVFLDISKGIDAADVQKNWAKITDMTDAEEPDNMKQFMQAANAPKSKL